MLAGMPGLILIPALFVAGAIGGALYGGLAGYLRARFSVNEVLTTVMLNYVMIYLLSYLLTGPWRSPDTFFQQSAKIVHGLQLPNLIPEPNCTLAFWWPDRGGDGLCPVDPNQPGICIGAVGMNEKGRPFKGIQRSAHWLIIVMLINGGIAGLCGRDRGVRCAGPAEARYLYRFGFTGIVIAVIALLGPHFGGLCRNPLRRVRQWRNSAYRLPPGCPVR